MAQGFASAGRAMAATVNGPHPDDYVRPAEWLSLGPPQTTTEHLKLLVAVLPGDSTYVAFRITGAFTVDFGDGSAPTNYASDTIVNKQYIYSSISAATEFRGYRQAIITITPQAGHTLNTLNMCIRPTALGGQTFAVSRYLDAEGYLPNCINLYMSSANSGNAQPRMMERFNLAGLNSITSLGGSFAGAVSLRSINMYTGLCSDFGSMFFNCTSLRWGPDLDTSTAVNMSNMFQGCGALKGIPLYNTSNVTGMGAMFASCAALETVPALNTSIVNAVSQMFRSCTSLKTVPAFNFISVTGTLSLFCDGCGSLTSVNIINTQNVTDFSTAFQGCTSLLAGPALDTSAATNMASMFNGCRSMKSVPLYNTARVTSFSATFANCASLATVPLLNTAAAVTFNAMFQNCESLQTIPLFVSSLVTDVRNMFSGCANLLSVPALDFSAVTLTGTGLFGGCTNLSSIAATGLRFAFTVAAPCNLSASALDAMYTAMGTASGAQSVTVSGTPGASGDTPSIATSKGWTVVGS